MKQVPFSFGKRDSTRTVMMFLMVAIFWQPSLAQHGLKVLYDSLFQTENVLISGMEYNFRYPQSKGHPFFGEQSWRRGSVKIQHMDLAYDAIRFDLLNDQLLVQHFSESGSHIIKINRQYDLEFILDGHHFYYLENSGGSGSEPEPGYYELAYGTDIAIWVRWKKSLAEGSQGNNMYEENRDLFIKNRDRFIRITNRKSLLGVFPDAEDEIRAYLKKERIVVRRLEPDELEKVVRYYVEQLN